jgi:hypothetical protein
VGGLWDSNINFLSPKGPDNVAVVPRGTLARVFRGPRGELRLQAQGRWLEYTDGDQESRGYARFQASGTRRSSLATWWRGDVAYEIGHTDSSQPLADQGVLLPLSRTRTLTAFGGVTHSLGTRTSLLVDGRALSTRFDVPGLVDGTSARGTLTLEQRFSPRTTADLVYALEWVHTDEAFGGTYLTHFGSLQWTRLLTPRTALLLEAGAGYTPDATRAGLDSKWSFFGGTSLNRQLGASTLTAFVRREVVPAFGTGVSRLEIRGGLRAAVPMGRDWLLALSATHVIPDDPASGAVAYGDADDAALSLRRQLGGRVSISGEGSYRRRGPAGPLVAVESYNAGLFLTFGSHSVRPREPRRASVDR